MQAAVPVPAAAMIGFAAQMIAAAAAMLGFAAPAVTMLQQRRNCLLLGRMVLPKSTCQVQMIQMILYCSRIVSHRSVDTGTQRSVDAGTQRSKKAEPTCHVQRRIQILSDCSCIISERSKTAGTQGAEKRGRRGAENQGREAGTQRSRDAEPTANIVNMCTIVQSQQTPGSDPA